MVLYMTEPSVIDEDLMVGPHAAVRFKVLNEDRWLPVCTVVNGAEVQIQLDPWLPTKLTLGLAAAMQEAIRRAVIIAEQWQAYRATRAC